MIKLNERSRSIRLNRFISNSGLCNRREADELIKKGEIKVNGKVVTQMGVQVIVGKDTVSHNGKPLSGETMQYVLINKPQYYVVEGKGGKSIFALMSDAAEERLYPVSPLGLKDVGLQLFTNDSDLSERLKEKGTREGALYHITFEQPIAQRDMDIIRKGIKVGKRIFKIKEAIITEGSEGRSLGLIPEVDEPKRIHEALGVLRLDIVKFDRVTYGGLTKKNLPRGKWRKLEDKEVAFLQMAVR